MNAPTTRETADHIGEANEKVADHIGDATTMIDHAELADQARRDLEWSCLTTIRPTALLALLSEIAAQRGERDTWKAMAENGAGGIIAHIDRATQAERQRDELRKALETIDGVLSDEIKARFGTSSSTSEAELGKGSMIYSLLIVPRDVARQALANQGADQ